MLRRIPLKLNLRAAALGLLLFTGVPVFAQEEEKPWVEPGLTMLDAEKPWAQWLMGFFFVVVCAGIAFKNPHRSHLD
jgi:hypothetical protein